MSRPAQIQLLSRFAGAYDPVVALMGFPPLWKAIAAIADPAPGECALDVCTGTGGAALELARRGARVTGLDLAPGLLRRARRKTNGNGANGHGLRPHFVRMDARRLGFRTGAFPLVTCSMALHEMAEEERGEVLREIARVAAGRVVIAEHRVPDDPCGALLFRVARVFEYLESDDFERFVRLDFRQRLEGAGFAVDAGARDVGGYRIWTCRRRAT